MTGWLFNHCQILPQWGKTVPEILTCLFQVQQKCIQLRLYLYISIFRYILFPFEKEQLFNAIVLLASQYLFMSLD